MNITSTDNSILDPRLNIWYDSLHATFIKLLSKKVRTWLTFCLRIDELIAEFLDLASEVLDVLSQVTGHVTIVDVTRGGGR